MKADVFHLIAAMASVSVLACGSSGAGSNSQPTTENGDGGDSGAAVPREGGAPEAGASDAPSDVGLPDHGAPSSTYPAFPPNFPQLKNQGGSVMKNPVIVAVTWSADPSEATFDTYADGIGSTDYWKTASSEYGVGPAVSGAANHVSITTAPPTQINDMQLQDMVTSNAGKTAGWPPSTAETIYAFFLPPGTSLQVSTGLGGGGDACSQGVGGYHQATTTGNMPYAVVPSCNRGNGTSAAQETAEAMSHELLESVTDPQPNGPTYLGFDDEHFAWDYFQQLQVENGDACEFYKTSFFEDKESAPTAFDFWVQRTWSNASGKAGHDPCVPAPTDPYFNVTPLVLQDVNVPIPAQANMFLPGLSNMTKGIVAPTGKATTFPIGFYSDGPTAGPWAISVADGNPVLGSRSIIDQMFNPSTLTVSVDKTSGQNGEIAYVTVNVTSPGSLLKGEIVTVTSTLGGVSHYMPIWIASQ